MVLSGAVHCGGQRVNLRKFVVGGGAGLLIASGSFAGTIQEVTAYEYDSLGRLVRTSNTGGPNSGATTGTCFDKAGNRVQYVVSASGPPVCATQSASISAPAGAQSGTATKSGARQTVREPSAGN